MSGLAVHLIVVAVSRCGCSYERHHLKFAEMSSAAFTQCRMHMINASQPGTSASHLGSNPADGIGQLAALVQCALDDFCNIGALDDYIGKK